MYLSFKIGLFGILMSSSLSSLYILEISPMSDVGVGKIFFHSVGCHLDFFTVSSAVQKLFSFMGFYLLIVALSVCVTGLIFRKRSHVLMCSRLLPTLPKA